MRQIATVLLAASSLTLAACSDDSSQYPTSEGKPTPYILKEGCRFTIVEEYSRSGVTSPEVSGVPGSTASASISLDEMSITVSDCRLIENSHALPVYED